MSEHEQLMGMMCEILVAIREHHNATVQLTEAIAKRASRKPQPEVGENTGSSASAQTSENLPPASVSTLPPESAEGAAPFDFELLRNQVTTVASNLTKAKKGASAKAVITETIGSETIRTCDPKYLPKLLAKLDALAA